jgi:hypothetical protein
MLKKAKAKSSTHAEARPTKRSLHVGSDNEDAGSQSSMPASKAGPSSRPAKRARVESEEDVAMREADAEVIELDEEGNVKGTYNGGSGCEEEEDDETLLGMSSLKFSSGFIRPWKSQHAWQRVFNKPIYACFKPAEVKYDGRGRRYLNFLCDGKGCRNEIKRYLDTQDKSSIGALRKHVKKCWGPDVLDSLDEAADVGVAREKICKPYKLNGTITAVFERIGQEKVTYSHRQLTRTQTK